MSAVALFGWHPSFQLPHGREGRVVENEKESCPHWWCTRLAFAFCYDSLRWWTTAMNCMEGQTNAGYNKREREESRAALPFCSSRSTRVSVALCCPAYLSPQMPCHVELRVQKYLSWFRSMVGRSGSVLRRLSFSFPEGAASYTTKRNCLFHAIVSMTHRAVFDHL